MADAVDTVVLVNTNLRYHIRITNRSDGTGESAVIKADKSTLTGPLANTEPGSLVLEEIEGIVDGMQVRLDWDHNTDDEIVTLGNGPHKRDFRKDGGLKDPKTAGGTGDVLLTTNGHSAGDSYDLTLRFRKKA